MTAIHETAYPRLKPNPDEYELKQNFFPTKEETELLNKNTSKKSPHSQLGFMLSLKCYQCLGYHISTNAIPNLIIDYVANSIEIKLNKAKLQNYMQLKQRKRHKAVIRKFLAINDSKQVRKTIMKSASLKSAAIKENLADIINDILEEIIKNSLEIPAFSTLLRMARNSRTIVSSALYQKVSNQLTDETKQFFDQLLLTETTTSGFSSGWEYLKQEMKKPSVTNIRQFTDYLEQLRKWQNQSSLDLSDIPEHRLNQYVAEAMALDIADMRRIKEAKRYALSAMLLYQQYATSLDSIVTVLARWLRQIKNDATESLEEIRDANRKITDQLIGGFKQVLIASKQTVQTPEEKLSLIEQSFPNDIDASLEACEQYLIYADDNDLPLMLKYYQAKRHTMFRLLRQIEIKSASKDMLVERLVKFILAHQRSHGEKIEISPREFNNFEWLDDQWFQFVTDGKTRRSVNRIKTVNQQKLELAVFKLVVDEINCADAFVLNSYENDDPNKQFISWDEFYYKLKPYTEMIGKHDNAREFIKELQEEQQQAAEKVNRNFVDNEYLSIIDGEPVLKRAIS